MRPKTLLVLIATLATAPHLANAQAPRPTAATPPAHVSSSSFGDWVLRCENRTAPANGRACEVLQSLQSERGQPVAQFALGRAAASDPMRLLVLIPANITVATPILLQLNDRAASIPVTLRACGPRGCVADVDLNAAQLARIRAREGQGAGGGRLEYRNALNGEVALPFSTRGFGQALDGLAREGF